MHLDVIHNEVVGAACSTLLICVAWPDIDLHRNDDTERGCSQLPRKGVLLNLGGSVYDPTASLGRLLFNVLGMVAEFEADLIRARTREGVATAKAAGKLRGKKLKVPVSLAEKHLVVLHREGTPATSEIAERFSVAHSTV